MKFGYLRIKRIFDVTFSFIALITFLPLFLIIACIIAVFDGLPLLYWSDRIGINGKIFQMPKFRTMKPETPAVATDLLQNPDTHVTQFGSILRKTSLDELPQLWSIFIGDMSFVGPRPALFNQYDLILGREALGINTLKPGLTGWAQINGRDEIELEKKLQYEKDYLFRQSFWFDIYILCLTFLKVILKDGVSH